MTVSFGQMCVGPGRNGDRPEWGTAPPLASWLLASGSHVALGLHCGTRRSRQEGKRGITLAAQESEAGLKGTSTLFFLVLLRTEPRALGMLGKHFTTELHTSSAYIF